MPCQRLVGGQECGVCRARNFPGHLQRFFGEILGAGTAELCYCSPSLAEDFVANRKFADSCSDRFDNPGYVEAKFRDGIEQGNGETTYRIALSQPKNFQLMRYAAQTFIENQREDLATPIIRQMVEQNPGNLAGWRLLERVSKTEAEKAEIRAKILALDPKNPELKNS